ncbi:DUF1045 domain-containing protein [Rhodanobacter sp. C05]|uniref:DUF1045 domain-containing protein n=1 Tax=Rhodanobacter sp. C05 TaxID=1945855 RepID=UPI000984F655|nr:DUF1045 domain-containing protein [Rhodanobacter sp. C05]OOG43628.1 hypothetical protein B0E51_02235 [Rhodanobacter sp. C05]
MRYAIYFCPANDTALGQLGRDWLAASTDAPELPGISMERRDALLANARRYGWHATIRAPFTLAADVVYDDVRRAVAAVARDCASFELSLRIERLASFLALRPGVDGAAPQKLAATCLEALEPLRASRPNAAQDRRGASLDAAELVLLQRYGYPYVLDRYRFHFTLSAPATESEEQVMRQWLEPRVAELPLTRVDALSICHEAAPGDAFELLERIPLCAPGMDRTS